MKENKLIEESKELIHSFLTTQFHKMKPNSFNDEKTLVLVVDMIKGFAKQGALYSDRVEKIIPLQAHFLKQVGQSHIQFVNDGHPENAQEFTVFPPHCIKGSEESEIVEELKPYLNKDIIYKNSTNGYLENALQTLLHKEFKHIVIVGCCTDLCILQLALTIKAHYNRLNKEVSLYVPFNLVDTYHLDATYHPGDFMHLIALKMMQDNGINIIEMEVENDLVK